MPPLRSESNAPKQVDYGEWSTKAQVLAGTLQLAVPLWIEQLRGRPWEWIQERAKLCSDHIGEHGDMLMFRGKKKGQSAEAFNRLAEGIACLSFCPGGVKIFGSHWESCLIEDVPGRSRLTLLDLCASITKVLQDASAVK